MTTYYLGQAALRGVLAERTGLAGVSLLSLGDGVWERLSDPDQALASLRSPRGPQSPKGFFLPPSESMGSYGPAASAAPAATATTEAVELLGVRACELRARAYLDNVLRNGDFVDPHYVGRCDTATVVSCDCTDCAASCFCTMVGGEPFPRDGFEVNLTPVADGYVAEAATEKGKAWLGGAASTEASADQIAERDRLRQEMVDRVSGQNAGAVLDARAVAAGLPDDADAAWQRFAGDCVECGACTNICPTCHCFYLYDQLLGPAEFERVRTWDSCLLSTYHRMAGVAGTKLTPRPRLSSRLANRVLHKFSYSLRQYELMGCVGCGRCVDACIGTIDIREVVKELGQ